MKKTLMAISVTIALALVGSACSSGHSGMQSGDGASTESTPPPSIPAGADFNEADVTFAQQMIPHHAQAVQMADMALEKASSAQVKDLAARIKSAQDPEIQTMSGWLNSWGQDVPDTSMGSGGHGTMSTVEGMMTDAGMKSLDESSGAEFDQMFLEMMVRHHEGAVAMAKLEITNGKDASAKELAEAIVTAQESEITEMNQLMSSLPRA